MPRFRQPRSHRVPSHRSILRRQPSTALDPNGATGAPGVATLAPSFGQALPRLDQVPIAYSHEFDAELVYELCAALVRERLGTPECWEKSGEDALVFARQAIMSGIGEDRWNLLHRNVEYHLQVNEVSQQDVYDTAFEPGKLVVTIECGGSGYLKLGPAIGALEAEAEGLGAAFYWTLTYALYRVMRLYNHDDAMQYAERMREYAEEEDQGEGTQYEFPEVEKALPECVRRTLTHDHKGGALDARRLLRACRNGRYGGWIEKLRKIEQISRASVSHSADYLHSGRYDSEPLPALLVSFEEHDAITACFDEEGQYMLEGSAEPALAIVFSPTNADEVRHALRAVGRFLALNQTLFELIEELQAWEKSHAGEHFDRGEPSLRAA